MNHPALVGKYLGNGSSCLPPRSYAQAQLIFLNFFYLTTHLNSHSLIPSFNQSSQSSHQQSQCFITPSHPSAHQPCTPPTHQPINPALRQSINPYSKHSPPSVRDVVLIFIDASNNEHRLGTSPNHGPSQRIEVVFKRRLTDQ